MAGGTGCFRKSPDSGESLSIRAWKSGRSQDGWWRSLGGATGLRPRLQDLFWQGRNLGHSAASGRRQVFAGERHRNGSEILEGIPGESTWQEEVKTGMKVWQMT